MRAPLGYRLVRALARLLARVFYGRLDVVGVEHVPAHGPLIVVANHQNGLVDPMLLMATLPRRLVPLAKEPLFHSPLFAPLLKMAGAIPVRRRQDEPGAAADPARNAAMFASARQALQDDRAILIFPEGVSQPEPRLMPLRSGAARLALGAGVDAPLTILPVGLVFDDPGSFRSGRALITVGAPLVVEPGGREATEQNVHALTADFDAAVRRLIVDARDRETYRLLRLADRIWSGDASAEGDAAERAARLRQLMRAHDFLASAASGRLAALRRDLEEYARDLAAAGVAGGALVGRYTTGMVLRYALREGVALALAYPLGVWGTAVHGIPYQLIALVVRIARPAPDTEATVKMTAGLVLYPVAWIAEGWLVWRLGGPWALAIFAVSLLPTGVLALTWRDRWERVRRDVAAFLQFLRDRDLHRRLLARRRCIAEEMETLARLVPASVLDAERRA